MGPSLRPGRGRAVISTGRRSRAISVAFAATIVTVAFAVNATPAAATSCTVDDYGGYKTTYFHNRGIEGDILYEKDDFLLSNNDKDHAAAYLNNFSQHDPAAIDTRDWVQSGFYVGNGDGNQTDTTKVYAETNGPNGGPDVYSYSYPWGNRYFTNEFVDEFDSQGRGLYYSWYSLNYQVLGHAYLIDPLDVRQDATIEGHEDLHDSSYCPSIGGIEFGTTGTPGSWTTATQLAIYNDQEQYPGWTPSHVAATNITSGPYHINVANYTNAFGAYGGG